MEQYNQIKFSCEFLVEDGRCMLRKVQEWAIHSYNRASVVS